MNMEFRQEQERVDGVIDHMNDFCLMIRLGVER
jgi:hypothetical protein